METSISVSSFLAGFLICLILMLVVLSVMVRELEDKRTREVLLTHDRVTTALNHEIRYYKDQLDKAKTEIAECRAIITQLKK